MAITLEKKREIVEDLKRSLDENSVFILTDYLGLSVSEIGRLRRQLEKDGCRMKVCKNTLIKKALKERGGERLDALMPDLKGPTALVFAKADPIAVSKSLQAFAKENEFLKVKAGFSEGSALRKSDIESLAKLGSKEELLGKLIMILKSPAINLIFTLNGPVTRLTGVLKAIAEKQVGK